MKTSHQSRIVSGFVFTLRLLQQVLCLAYATLNIAVVCIQNVNPDYSYKDNDMDYGSAQSIYLRKLYISADKFAIFAGFWGFFVVTLILLSTVVFQTWLAHPTLLFFFELTGNVILFASFIHLMKGWNSWDCENIVSCRIGKISAKVGAGTWASFMATTILIIFSIFMYNRDPQIKSGMRALPGGVFPYVVLNEQQPNQRQNADLEAHELPDFQTEIHSQRS